MSSHHRRVLLAVCALAIFVSPRPVRGQELTGTWTSEVPVRVAATNGSEQVEQTATVTLSLQQHGDSVHGTWQMSPLPDRPNPPARQLRGVVHDGRIVLTDTTEAMIRRNGEPPSSVTMINTLELRLDGDRLSGTQSARSADGMVSTQPRAFTATRVRS